LIGGIGLPGGAVYIDHSAIRSRIWDSLVSLAGPIGTALCGLLIAIPFLWPGHYGWITQSNAGFFIALGYLGFIEVIAVLLNLLPVPGLDGFGILRPWLSYSLQSLAIRYSQLSIIALFVLLFYFVPVRTAFFNTALQVSNMLGIDTIFVVAGQAAMRFF
jgi:Zn-dependent protease